MRRKANPRGSWSARCPLGFAATFLQDLLSCTTHGPVVQLSLPMPCAHHMQPNTCEGSVYCAPPLRFSKKATRGPWGPRGTKHSELPPGVALCLSVLRGIRAHQQSSKKTTRATSRAATLSLLFCSQLHAQLLGRAVVVQHGATRLLPAQPPVRSRETPTQRQQ